MTYTVTVPSWTLSTIISETRGITGRPDVNMMDNQTVANYINYYYQFVMPKELKIFWGYTNYQFFCQANVDQYPVPNAGVNGTNINFQTFNPVAYADGWPIQWQLDPDTFFQDYPQQENKQVVGNGNGTNNNFSFNISAYPVLARSVYVTDGTQVAQDVPNGNGTGHFVNASNGATIGGSIAYVSGVVSGLSFPSIPAANTNITCTSQTYQANRPQSILFYKQAPLADATTASLNAAEMFVLRPVPDQVYKITMKGIQVPPALVNDTDVPFRPDLGPLIAIGASLHIFKLFNQMDQYNELLGEYARYKDICMQDTYEELLYERSIPKF